MEARKAEKEIENTPHGAEWKLWAARTPTWPLLKFLTMALLHAKRGVIRNPIKNEAEELSPWNTHIILI